MLDKRKVTAAVLAGAMMTVAAVPAFAVPAQNEITSEDKANPSNGGEGTSDVQLTSTTDGKIPTDQGGDSADDTAVGNKFSVTVPSVLPVAVSVDGVTKTATNCQITNHSYGPVKVSKIVVNDGDWTVANFKDTNFAKEKVDSKKIGLNIGFSEGMNEALALKTQLAKKPTTASGAALISKAADGCYLTGKDGENNALNVDYEAKVSPLSKAADHAKVAQVVFTVEWDGTSETTPVVPID